MITVDALCSGLSAINSWTHSFLLHGDSGNDSTASPAGATTGIDAATGVLQAISLSLVELRYHIFQFQWWETGRRCQICIPIFLSIIGRPSCLSNFPFIFPSVPVFLETQNLLVTPVGSFIRLSCVCFAPPNSITLLSPLAWYTSLGMCSDSPQSCLGACCEEPLWF